MKTPNTLNKYVPRLVNERALKIIRWCDYVQDTLKESGVMSHAVLILDDIAILHEIKQQMYILIDACRLHDREVYDSGFMELPLDHPIFQFGVYEERIINHVQTFYNIEILAT